MNVKYSDVKQKDFDEAFTQLVIHKAECSRVSFVKVDCLSWVVTTVFGICFTFLMLQRFGDYAHSSYELLGIMLLVVALNVVIEVILVHVLRWIFNIVHKRSRCYETLCKYDEALQTLSEFASIFAIQNLLKQYTLREVRIVEDWCDGRKLELDCQCTDTGVNICERVVLPSGILDEYIKDGQLNLSYLDDAFSQCRRAFNL